MGLLDGVIKRTTLVRLVWSKVNQPLMWLFLGVVLLALQPLFTLVCAGDSPSCSSRSSFQRSINVHHLDWKRPRVLWNGSEFGKLIQNQTERSIAQEKVGKRLNA
jgi:hypothetical protein